MDEDYIMLFGMHKGEHVEDVPASYLLWILNETDVEGLILDYIEENVEAITAQAEEEKNENR